MSDDAQGSTASQAPRARRTDVLGCPVDVLDLPATLERSLAFVRDGKGRQSSINAGKVVMASTDPSLAEALRSSDIASADGVPIVWAARLLGHPLPGRVNGTDLMQELMREGSERGLRAFILGARPEVLERAVERVGALYPGLVIAGAHHGYFGPEEEDQVVREINAARPDLLFLAMSSPMKEFWLDRHWERLDVGFAMGVGGSIDVLAGEVPRAPRWMQRYGLEWLFRLRREPRRMWRRYLVGNTTFLWMLGREVLRRRLRRA